jgi:hypothetical protein
MNIRLLCYLLIFYACLSYAQNKEGVINLLETPNLAWKGDYIKIANCGNSDEPISTIYIINQKNAVDRGPFTDYIFVKQSNFIKLKNYCVAYNYKTDLKTNPNHWGIFDVIIGRCNKEKPDKIFQLLTRSQSGFFFKNIIAYCEMKKFDPKLVEALNKVKIRIGY